GLGAELRFEPFGDAERFRQRQIPLLEARAEQAVASDAAKNAALWTPPWSEPLAVLSKRRDLTIRRQRRCLEPLIARRMCELPIAYKVRPAPAGVAIGIAIEIARRERQPALPRIDRIQLPAADDEVGCLASPAQELAPLAERQFPHSRQSKDV